MIGENGKPRVSIIGLGKLGASMLAGMAHRGFEVIGVDINSHAVRAVNDGKAPVQETGLGEMINANKARIRATGDFVEAILGSDISFVIVPTPSEPSGAFSLEYAKSAFKEIGKALRVKSDYHVVVLTSTVLPGGTRFGLLPFLETESGKICGKDFGLCYSPEFIALGSVIRDFLNPDFYLIGEFDKRSGDLLEVVDRAVCQKAEPVCRRMSIENAEIAKIALNSFVTLKISYANLLADLCERVPGGDVDVVTDAIGTDSRIGRKYLTGGLGFAGPCFPRDNVALSFFGKAVGADTTILETNHHFNITLGQRLVKKWLRAIPAGRTVAILGLAYKPSSHVIEESQGVLLATELFQRGYQVRGYDPLAAEQARAALGDRASVFSSLADCLKGADVIVIATPDSEFRNLVPSDLFELPPKESVFIVDCWRILSPQFKGIGRVTVLEVGKAGFLDPEEEVVQRMWSGK